MLLHSHNWSIADIIAKYRENAPQLLVNSKIKPSTFPTTITFSRYLTCPVCVVPQPYDKFGSLSCQHQFCKECWTTHFEVQLSQVRSNLAIVFKYKCLCFLGHINGNKLYGTGLYHFSTRRLRSEISNTSKPAGKVSTVHISRLRQITS